MEGLINISDFMNHLEKNGLVIVKADEFIRKSETGKNISKSAALQKDELTLAEIAETRLLNVGTKQAIRAMITKGIISRKDYRTKNGKIVVRTAAIKRIRAKREIA